MYGREGTWAAFGMPAEVLHHGAPSRQESISSGDRPCERVQRHAQVDARWLRRCVLRLQTGDAGARPFPPAPRVWALDEVSQGHGHSVSRNFEGRATCIRELQTLGQGYVASGISV